MYPGPDHWFDHLPEDKLAPNAKPTDPLPPFRYITSEGKVDNFTSDKVKDWTSFGYQYEILESPGDLKQKLATLYNRAAPLMLAASRLVGTEKIEGTDNDYIANVVYDR